MATIAARGLAVGAPALLLVGNAQASGLGARPDVLGGVTGALRGAGARVEEHLTETVEELEGIVANADGRRLVVMGGDGSLHALANLRRPPAEVAIVPAGSANNIAVTLGVPLDPRAAVELAIDGHARSIDGIDSGSGYIALEGISVGFLARARTRYASPNSADVWKGLQAGLAELRSFEPVAVDVAADGESERLEVSQLFAANMPRYAFGLRVAPDASPTDGLLDLVAVGPRSRAGFLRELARLRRGAVPLLRRAARVTLRAEGSPIVADSTNLGSGPLDLVVRRDVLRVVAP
jgi:diacylglycerol kinase (ATP)